MSDKVTENLVAPCGIHCATCEMYRAKDEPRLKAFLISKGIAADKIPCAGCRAIQGNCPVIASTCATFNCASERGHRFCYECADFPCAKLNPAADRAAILPHNLKTFNLCYIQKQGLDAFLTAAESFRTLYYQGKMAIGAGPQMTKTIPEQKP